MSFAEYLTTPHDPQDPDAGIGVGFLASPQGNAWLRALGAQLDWLGNTAKESVKARCPGLCPSDALPYLAAERGLPRGPYEPEASWRTRLLSAWDIWQWAGTAIGLLRALWYAGFSSPIIQTQVAKQYSLDANLGLSISDMPTPVHLGGTPTELVSDFSVYLCQPWPSWWNGAAPADGTPEQKATAELIRAWKPADARCVRLTVVDGPIVGLNITVGPTFTVGYGTATTWSPPIL